MDIRYKFRILKTKPKKTFNGFFFKSKAFSICVVGEFISMSFDTAII